MKLHHIIYDTDMILYLIDCTLATAAGMAITKGCPKGGEFKRQCNIAQKAIDYLGPRYNYEGTRADAFAHRETAYDYYTRQRTEWRKEMKWK